VEKVGIHVKQTPGLSYPKPVRHVYIHEQARAPWLNFCMPWRKKHQHVRPDVPCDDGQCVDGDSQPTYTAANPPAGPASAPDYVLPPDVH
jgi:hypothetical protein